MNHFTYKGCTDRHPGCHGKCEKYQREKAEYEKEKAELVRQREIETSIDRQRRDWYYKVSRGKKYRSKYKRTW